MRRWWLIYGSCALLVTLALVWMSHGVLQLERAAVSARTDARHQERVRLSLWRMDGWLAPRLATEIARPVFEYSPLHSIERPYEAVLTPPREGQAMARSPLLTYVSDDVLLHFQVGEDGVYRSPQVPSEQEQSLAAGHGLPTSQAEAKRRLLDDLVSRLTSAQLRAAFGESMMCMSLPTPVARDRQAPAAQTLGGASVAAPGLARETEGPASPWIGQAEKPEQQLLLNRAEFSKRSQNFLGVNAPADSRPAGPGAGIEVGAFAPVWFGEGDPGLLFARRVNLGGETVYQGFLLDWPRLHRELLDEIADLLPGATLSPLSAGDRQALAAEDEADAGLVLASVPAKLEAPVQGLGADPPEELSPMRLALVVTWAVVLVGLVAVGLTLRSAVVLGEKRIRFASAVTHELRTPLTTFRMYSEMLADDMVSDPGQRQAYLETLKEESERLAKLVENVLSYARLEEGRAPTRPEPTTVGGLLDRIAPTLQRRAESGAMDLAVDAGGLTDRPLRTDVSVVGQILFNLVDNAVKYATGAVDRTIHVEPSVHEGQLTVLVRDHGPGVPRADWRSVFRPFERRATEATPGVGLGLSLSRGLARELGGDLKLEPSGSRGACFRLTVPLGV